MSAPVGQTPMQLPQYTQAESGRPTSNSVEMRASNPRPATAMAKSLIKKGAHPTNAFIFMFASTNLVIDLGIVIWVLLGWQFFVAEIVGGILMIALLFLYLYNVQMLPLQGQARATLVAYANLAFSGFIVAAICLRFAYPSLSAEGRAVWMLQSAPISWRRLLVAKVVVYGIPLIGLSLVLTAAAAVARADRAGDPVRGVDGGRARGVGIRASPGR